MDVFAGDGVVDTDTRRDKGETEGADDIGGDEDQAIGINEENKGTVCFNLQSLGWVLWGFKS